MLFKHMLENHLQKSRWISFNPTLRRFSAWLQGYGGFISRKSSLKKRQIGQEDCRVRLLQAALGLCLLLAPLSAQATPQQAWQEAIALAQQGHDQEAIALMRGAQLQYNLESHWAQRFAFASRLLALREKAKHHSTYNSIVIQGQNNHENLTRPWLAQHPKPEDAGSVIPGLLSSIIPGAGHAWLDRWRDAGVAAMLVWPLLILTFWAARRDMGPVTVFFALITAWLWSGTVFSAVSLAERGDYELWYAWWQQMWQASGLPSKPW